MTAKSHSIFRFSLRTMFVVVTALCCYLGWEISIVRQRQAMLRELRGQPYVQITTADAWAKHLQGGGWRAPKPAQVRQLRIWLGDEAIQEIACGKGHHHLSQEQLDQLPIFFREAKVHEYEVLFEPCHPGCFPRGTLIQAPNGPRLIEGIRVGEAVTAFRPNGNQIMANVASVFVTRNRLWKVETEDAILLTTQTQPLCLPNYQSIPAGDLEPGDQVLRFVDGELHPVTVRAVYPTDRLETVYNLVLGNSEQFVAGGFVARSKPPTD